MTENTLTFDAELVAVKVGAKAGQYGEPSKGSIDVTFRVKRPAPPREPYSNRWSEPNKEDHETDKDYKKEHKRWAAEEEKCQAEMAKHQAALQALKPQLMSYASIAGMAAVLDGNTVTVEIRPGEQQFLEGFGVQLLAAPDTER